MPKVFEWRGYRFHFFSNEGFPLESVHIHVRKGQNRAKFWIKPVIALASNYGFIGQELIEFRNKIEENKDLIQERWYEHFNI
jgi:hypothetical protein